MNRLTLYSRKLLMSTRPFCAWTGEIFVEDILQEEKTHMVESEIRLLGGETCLSKIIIGQFAGVKLILSCFSQRLLCSWVAFPIGH